MFSMSQQRNAPQELIDFATTEIRNVLMNVKGIDFVMLCSTDGFELATVNKKTVFNNSKLAAVSSSILAMVSAFLTEINLVGCQTITLDAENGKAILTSVPAPHHPMVIVALTAKDVLLGQLLYTVKQASLAIIQADQQQGQYKAV